MATTREDVAPSVHPLVEQLLGLVGAWTGSGRGQLPGREPFTWSERFEIGHGGTPALWFRQRTTRPDGSPFHAEDGWLRVPPERQDGGDALHVELAVTSPTGVLEALDGTIVTHGHGLELSAHSTGTLSTTVAATVLATGRRWVLDGDHLTVDFSMALPDHPEIFHHLTAELRRDDRGGTTT